MADTVEQQHVGEDREPEGPEASAPQPRAAPSEAAKAPSMARRVATAVGFVALAASLVIGTDMFGAREALFGSATPPPRASAFSRVFRNAPPAQTNRTVLRSQPWWQEVETLRGSGPLTTPPLDIGADAIQWRMRWSCTTGRFKVTSAGLPTLVDAACPATRTTEAATRPRVALNVDADGPWTMRVERQIDVPLVEPPLPAMTAPRATRLAVGRFYGIDQVGRGRVTVYRLPNGRHALRLDNFYVTPNIDLEIRLSPLREPRSTRQYQRASSALVRMLDVTTGSMNFMIPRGVDPRRYRSVVLWCQNLISAYAAATLRTAR
jgi:hypothetical protein